MQTFYTVVIVRLRTRKRKQDIEKMHIFCITNNKGGVAKTTSAINIGYALADQGHKVLIVDADPQCNATYALLGSLEYEKSLYEVLQENLPIAQAIKATKHQNLSVVPCSINLSAADVLMASAHGRERRLERALKPITDHYDFIIIDTPPQLGILTINALVACTEVLIPFTLSTFALIGSGVLEETMASLRQNLDLKLPVLGVFGTLDERTVINKNVLHSIGVQYGDKLFKTTIPKNVAVEYAHNQAESIFEYEATSKAAEAYKQLAEEILERVGLGDGR